MRTAGMQGQLLAMLPAPLAPQPHSRHGCRALPDHAADAACLLQVRECQEQMVLLDRAHTLKVQQIQKEYQDFMERIRSKAQTAIDQANRDYQHRKTIFGAKMNVMVEYLNQQLPMQQLQQQFQRAAQLPAPDAPAQGDKPVTPRSTAAKEAAFMALLMGQAAQQAEVPAPAGAEAAAPKSGSDGGTQPAQPAAAAPPAGQQAGAAAPQQAQQQAAAAAQQAAADAASMQQAVPAAIAGLHTGNLPGGSANTIVIADRHNMSTMQVSELTCWKLLPVHCPALPGTMHPSCFAPRFTLADSQATTVHVLCAGQYRPGTRPADTSPSCRCCRTCCML
jgi:hypothetical protein